MNEPGSIQHGTEVSFKDQRTRYTREYVEVHTIFNIRFARERKMLNTHKCIHSVWFIVRGGEMKIEGHAEKYGCRSTAEPLSTFFVNGWHHR